LGHSLANSRRLVDELLRPLPELGEIIVELLTAEIAVIHGKKVPEEAE
jgi:hypothetical protein